MAKLGFIVCLSTVKNVMVRNGIPAAPERDKLGTSWHYFLPRYKNQILACDFFAVGTVGVKIPNDFLIVLPECQDAAKQT